MEGGMKNVEYEKVREIRKQISGELEEPVLPNNVCQSLTGALVSKASYGD